MSGKIVTFIKSSGGVGATTLAVQAACAMRDANLALLDLDIQYGAAAFQMDVESSASILELSAAANRLDTALLQGAMARPHDLFDLLAAPAGVYPMDDVSVDGVTAVLDIARCVYATVLVDLPMIWNEWGHAVLSRSDHIVLVTHLTIPSLRQARRQIEMIMREQLGSIPLFVVANRADRGLFAKGLSQKTGEKALGRAINFVIDDDPAIAMAADSGLPLAAMKAGAVAKKFARMMAQILATAEAPQLAMEA